MTTTVSPQKMLRVMAALPGKEAEISARVGIGRSTAAFALRNLVDQGQAHVIVERGIPIYRRGPGPGQLKEQREARERIKEEKRARLANSLLPRVDPMIWRTVGRKAPEVRG